MEDERRNGEPLPETEAAMPVDEDRATAEDATALENVTEEIGSAEATDEATSATEAEVPSDTPPAAPTAREQAPPEKPWDFGEAPAQKAQGKHGMIGFFGLFGCAFAVCMVMLALVLLLGDGRYEIVRNIIQERIVYVRQDDGTSGLLTPNEVAEKAKQYTVTVIMTAEGSVGIGSGFVYSADGYICTNYHAVDGAETVQVLLSNGVAYDATVKGYNEAADVAVLHINAPDLTAATLGSSAALLVGDEVMAMGTPGKLDYAATATFGNVSATKRLITVGNDDGTVTWKLTMIQTDAQVNPGNSGGPLVDMYGNVVGVVTRKQTELYGTSFEGLSFALPIDGVKQIVDEIIAKGSFTGKNPIAEGRSLLGVTGHGGSKGLWYADAVVAGSSVPHSETEQPGYHYMWDDGVYVSAISGSNAVGKLQEGDIITHVNGLRIYNTNDLVSAVNRYYAGERVAVTILRGGARMTVEVPLAENPLE